MQRYYAGEVIGDGNGPYVLASDAEAAIAAAEQRGYTRGYNDHAAAQQRAFIEYGGRP
jgi:hypothetical protein